jgi:excisionase family DNA binding protein
MTGNEGQLEATSALTSAEVAERLKVDPRTVRKLIRTGRLAAFTVGGSAHIRVTEAALADYIASNLIRATA